MDVDPWSSIDSAPEQVRSAAAEKALGSRFVRYQVAKGTVPASIVSTVVVGLLVALPVTVLVYIGSQDGGFLFFLNAGICVLALLVKVAATVRAIARRNDALYLFDNGLVHQGKAGIRAFPWRASWVARRLERPEGQES